MDGRKGRYIQRAIRMDEGACAKVQPEGDRYFLIILVPLHPRIDSGCW